MRTVLVFLTTLIALLLGSKLDQVTSIIGGCICTPLAFIVPVIIHYSLVAESQRQKIFDLFIISLAMAIVVFVTFWGFYNWQ